MVSNIRYFSFKGFDFRSKVPFVAMIASVPIIAVVFSDPPIVLFVIFTIYAASESIYTLFGLCRRRQERRQHLKHSDDSLSLTQIRSE